LLRDYTGQMTRKGSDNTHDEYAHAARHEHGPQIIPVRFQARR
jgi:hypothetical protein